MYTYTIMNVSVPHSHLTLVTPVYVNLDVSGLRSALSSPVSSLISVSMVARELWH